VCKSAPELHLSQKIDDIIQGDVFITCNKNLACMYVIISTTLTRYIVSWSVISVLHYICFIVFFTILNIHTVNKLQEQQTLTQKHRSHTCTHIHTEKYR